MSNNLIVNTAKAALTAVQWLLKLVVTLISGCASVVLVAFQHSSTEEESDACPLQERIDIDVAEGRY
jgi:hypothetical protein